MCANYWIPVLVLLAVVVQVPVARGDGPRFVDYGLQPANRAVVVDDVPLVHTAQLLARDKQGQITNAGDAAAQTAAVLESLKGAITDAGGDPQAIVKLNVYVSQLEVVPAVEGVIAKTFPAETRPASSAVVTRLPGEGALVAMDAVAVGKAARTVSVKNSAAVLPAGSRIYIAGQAEKGATLAEATRRTLESLQKTLQFLGRNDSDIVQLKSFLSPMANVAEAQQEFKAFFGDRPVPPTVWVEWQSPLIEIELIAWGGEKKSGQPAVEFLTPPGMTASPVYSRVTRTNSDQLVYLSGLYARRFTDAASEVTDIFNQLEYAAQRTGSDLRHLVKATYYCSNNDTSAKLNELRPKYYDPARPPSASKALVAGVGREQRGLTIDMIAVPAGK